MDQSHQSKDRVAKLLQTRFLQETYFSFKDTHRLTVKGLKEIVHANGNPKESRGGITYIRQNRL